MSIFRFILLPFIALVFATLSHAQYYTVTFLVSDSLLQQNEVSLAVKDAQALFAQSTKNSGIISDTVYIRLSIDHSLPQVSTKKTYPVIQVPEHAYRWESNRTFSGKLIHEAKSPSNFGLACSIYGLMQEALGFAFYHPRETYIPDLSAKWPLSDNFSMEVHPKFQKKGFHLHTQHPIELAEPLFNPQHPGGLEQVKEYIDWLARNEQNVFDFCLLESIDEKTWIEHAAAFTGYAKQRGVLTSVDVSLHMIQQKSIQLYRNPPQSFRSKKEQIKRSLNWLFKAHWDIINMEFNSAEFLTGNAAKRSELRRFVQEETEKRGAKLMGRQHIVQESSDFVRSKTEGIQHEAIEPGRGVLAHTVMCYSMTEPHAPVYENENQRHIFEFMKKENQIRETWYYPESAYWVTFDSSVPTFPLSYLSARLADIDTSAAYNVEGHLTFSSGWELGYWLIDWSIARWSRTVYVNHKKVENTPTQYLYGTPFTPEAGPIVDSLLTLHDEYLKEKNLMAYMTAQTVTDEIPNAVRKEFHPRPPFTYGWLRNKSDKVLRDSLRSHIIPLLHDFHKKSEPALQIMHKEIRLALLLTGLRAKHRAYILEYLVSISESKSEKSTKPNLAALENAKQTRMEAKKLMDEMTDTYRYSPYLTYGKYPNGTGFTSYDFGYLYTAQKLHFWEREEEQAKKNRYDFLFMNIWNVFRIIGLED